VIAAVLGWMLPSTERKVKAALVVEAGD
jgi:hypothetical protein